MAHTATPGLAASTGLIARMGPPAEPNGLLTRTLAGLRLWQEAFAEAQEMRREASERYPYIDS